MVQRHSLDQTEQGGEYPVEAHAGRHGERQHYGENGHNVEHCVHAPHAGSIRVHFLLANLCVNGHAQLQQTGDKGNAGKGKIRCRPAPIRTEGGLCAQVDQPQHRVVEAVDGISKAGQAAENIRVGLGIFQNHKLRTGGQRLFRNAVLGEPVRQQGLRLGHIPAKAENVGQRTAYHTPHAHDDEHGQQSGQAACHGVDAFLLVDAILLLLHLLGIVGVLFLQLGKPGVDDLHSCHVLLLIVADREGQQFNNQGKDNNG